MDISIVISGHNEGPLILAAIRSARAAMAVAANGGIECELLVVLDKPSMETLFFVRSNTEIDQIVTVEFGNASQSRMAAVDLCKGRYVSFLDGDDLWSADWLQKSYDFISSEINHEFFVCRSEVIVGFGLETFARLQAQATTKESFSVLNLISQWYFGINFIAPIKVLKKFPLQPYNRDLGFWSEDWHWSCELLAREIPQLFVPQTVYFYRQRRNSLNEVAGLTFRPTALFNKPELWRNSFVTNPVLGIFPEHSSYSLGQRERETPDWLHRSIVDTRDLEFELYGLQGLDQDLNLKLPTANPAIGVVYRQMYEAISNHAPTVLLVVEDSTDNTIYIIDETLQSLLENHSVALLNLSCNGSEDSCQTVINGLMNLPAKRLCRKFGLNDKELQIVVERLMLQYPIRKIVNFSSECFDAIVGRVGRGLQAAGVQTLRVSLANYPDIYLASAKASPRRSYHWIHKYSFHLCRSHLYSKWLMDISLETNEKICAVGSPGQRDTLWSERMTLRIAAFANDISNTEVKYARHNRKPLGRLPVDISLCVTASSEELGLAATLSSARRNARVAFASGIVPELILVACEPNRSTLNIIENALGAGIIDKFENVDAESLILKRRRALEVSEGKYISWQHAGDIQSENWLLDAYRRSSTCSEQSVYHPELGLFCGEKYTWFRHREMDHTSAMLEAHILVSGNPWTSTAFADRRVFESIPLELGLPEMSVRSESWFWNCEVLLNGWNHRVVENTSHIHGSRSEELRISVPSNSPYGLRRSELFDRFLKHTYQK